MKIDLMTGMLVIAFILGCAFNSFVDWVRPKNTQEREDEPAASKEENDKEQK